MKTKIFLLTLLLVFGIKTVNSQWVSYTTSNSILPDNQIYTIEKDLSGKILASIYYNGVSTFDGLQWRNCTFNTLISDSLVYAMQTDTHGNIWYGTDRAAYKSDGTNLVVYNNLSNVRDIAVDRLGNVWFATWNGLGKFDGTTWTIYTAANSGIQSDALTCIDTDSHGNIWIGTDNIGVIKFNGTNWTNYSAPFGGIQVSCIKADHNDNIWVSCVSLFKYDNTNWTEYNTSNSGIPWSEVSDIEFDANNNVWVATLRGIGVFNGNSWTVFSTVNSGIISSFTTSLVFDYTGRLWIGTLYGISVFDRNISGIYSPSISGKIYFDQNQNGMKDPLEAYIPNQKVLLLPDSIFAFTNQNGEFHYYVDSGNYSVRYIPQGIWSLSSANSSYSITLDTAQVSVPDFGVRADDTTNITVALSGGISRCNSTTRYWYYYKNEGTTTENGIVSFKPDHLTSFLNASPTYDSLSNGYYFWRFSNFLPGEDQQISIKLTMPGLAYVGDTLVSCASLLTSNIHKADTLIQIFVCSYDPNDKTVYPFGEGPEKYTLMGETLRYTIRFQNTGNDTAFNITIRDTLSPYLDLNSFQLLASSHTVNTNLKTSGALLFRFDNIMLPDSGHNQDLSQGYITYSIKPKAGLANHTEVRNTSYIFFDFNPAVQTNTTLNTMVYSLPVGIDDKKHFTGSKLNIYPNPTNGQIKITLPVNCSSLHLSIFNAQGQEIYRSEKPEKELDVKLPAAGLYLVKAYNDENEWSNKVIVVN